MIIDADGHFFETEEMFEKYMEPGLRNYRPRLLSDEAGHNFWVVDGQTAYKRPSIKGAGAPGTAAPPGKALQSARRASPGSQTLTNTKERLADLDREGIDLQYIYPSFLLHVNAWPDGVLAMGVCRAYNTWLVEACNKAPDRLQAVGVVSLADADGAAKEVERLKNLGVKAVMINGTTGAKRLDHPDHEPFFAAADRMKMPVAVHFSLQFPVVDKLFEHHFPNRVLAGILPIMAGLTSVLCSGMLDRYKNLKFAFLEGGISWVPAHVERMDDHFENPRYGAKDLISQPPSDYLKQGRIFFGCEGNESFLGKIVEEVGEDLFLYSSDYPHADRTEGTAKQLRDRSDMSAPTRKKLLEENARRFYG
ncbi:MAG: amidohydrolase [Deltaproteobacteria bacterium]|nr:amidohydrolase [Deltaproteobacteria bacterium]MBM4299689.1 amidohydrolase [Deltaproteobacteria bacterium]